MWVIETCDILSKKSQNFVFDARKACIKLGFFILHKVHFILIILYLYAPIFIA